MRRSSRAGPNCPEEFRIKITGRAPASEIPEHFRIRSRLTLGCAFTTEALIAKFRPCLHYDEKMRVLRVVLRDCSYTEKSMHGLNVWDVFYDNHPRTKQGKFVGVQFWDPLHMLARNNYRQRSISLNNLVNMYIRWYGAHLIDPCIERCLRTLRTHQFEWHIT